jgi:hypothetical protein
VKDGLRLLEGLLSHAVDLVSGAHTTHDAPRPTHRHG